MGLPSGPGQRLNTSHTNTQPWQDLVRETAGLQYHRAASVAKQGG